MNAAQIIVLGLVVLAILFGGFITLLEYLSRRRARKLAPLLGVVEPPESFGSEPGHEK